MVFHLFTKINSECVAKSYVHSVVCTQQRHSKWNKQQQQKKQQKKQTHSHSFITVLLFVSALFCKSFCFVFLRLYFREHCWFFLLFFHSFRCIFAMHKVVNEKFTSRKYYFGFNRFRWHLNFIVMQAIFREYQIVFLIKKIYSKYKTRKIPMKIT